MALNLPQPSGPRSSIIDDFARRGAELLSRAESAPGAGQRNEGIGITSFLTAFVASIIIFSVQAGFFVLLRNKLARIL